MCFSSPQGGAVEQGSQARDQHFIITYVKEVMFSPWFVYLFVNCCVSKSPSQCIILQFGQYVGLPNGSGWLHILCWSDLSWVEGAQCSTRALTVCANMIIAEHRGWNWMNSSIFKDCLQNVLGSLTKRDSRERSLVHIIPHYQNPKGEPLVFRIDKGLFLLKNDLTDTIPFLLGSTAIWGY